MLIFGSTATRTHRARMRSTGARSSAILEAIPWTSLPRTMRTRCSIRGCCWMWAADPKFEACDVEVTPLSGRSETCTAELRSFRHELHRPSGAHDLFASTKIQQGSP